MLLGFLALTACDGEPPAVAVTTSSPVETLFVDVSARVPEEGAPAAWTVRAAWGRPPLSPPLAVGECRRPQVEVPVGGPGAEEMTIPGTPGARLAWQPAGGSGAGVWGVVGPRQVLDPAWSVSDVAWTDLEGARHVADDVVRFGGLPDVTRVMRDREGGVSVRWDPATVGATEVRVSGPAGALLCGTTPDGTTLPWWVVPAYGGEIVLESVRENSALVDGVLVRVRTTLERVIHLDEPAGTTAEEEEAPAFRPYNSHGPRRLVRQPKHPVG